ncbi:21847_t:CDS:2, partial [Racocetra persica]
ATLGQVAASWAWLRGVINKNHNQDQFIDEWLNYSSQERPFSASSVKNPSFTKFSLRYWHIMLNAAPNLSKFACCLLSIPPNFATFEWVWSLLGNIHMEHHNRLSPVQAAKMSNILDNDDYIDNSDDIDEFMVNLNQISEKIINDIHVLDVNSEKIIPALKDVFDSKAVKKSLNFYINQS